MGNCFATMVGVLIGIPIGLKINQIQQRHLDEAGREKVEQDVAYRVRVSSERLFEELKYNDEQLDNMGDALGNYLGPWYAGALALKPEPELGLGPLKDNLDGIYSQVLELSENVNVGDVKISLSAQDAEPSFSLVDKVEEPEVPDLTFKGLLYIKH